MDPDPGHDFVRRIFEFFFFLMLKLDEPFRDQEIFNNFIIFNSSELCFERIKVFFSL